MSEKLREMQREMQSALLSGDMKTQALVESDGCLCAEQRLAIYRNAYQARLMEALAADFPALHAYIGDAAFMELVKDYSGFHPSRSFSLRWFGRHLCEFLGAREAYCDHDDLRELAKFEEALCHAFDAADSEVASVSALAQLAPELWPKLRLEFHASMKIITLRGNSVDVWRALSAHKELPEFQLQAVSTPWLIWRQDLKILFRSLELGESMALELFIRGEPFEKVCENLAVLMDDEQVPAFAAGLLGQWLGDGLIIRVSAD